MTRLVMSVDAIVTGLLISLADFNFEAGTVLISVLSVSTIIIGGLQLWVLLVPVCAVGMLRVTNAVYQSGSLQAGSKVVMITSQGGSIQWRDVQCPNGGDYGHHMSKSAANMAGKLIANELGTKGISTGVFHPGFVRTEMTSKYSHIWDIEGAVVSTVAAKRVWHEVNMLSPATNGKFINCEDGLEIPW